MTETYGFMNIDQQLRTLDLVQKNFDGDDLVMLVENAGAAVVGECERKFPDGKPRISIAGYSWGVFLRPGAPVNAQGKTMGPLVVVRRTDAATASLASLLANGSDKVKVCISAFRSGGDRAAVDTQPMFEMELEHCRITGHFLTTGGPLTTLGEILHIDYRSIMLRSATQLPTGARGPVRECQFTAPNPA